MSKFLDLFAAVLFLVVECVCLGAAFGLALSDDPHIGAIAILLTFGCYAAIKREKRCACGK